MKAVLKVTRWEESAIGWSEQRKAAIRFARITRIDPDNPESAVSGLWAVYRKGTILEGESAQNAIDQGVAEEVQE